MVSNLSKGKYLHVKKQQKIAMRHVFNYSTAIMIVYLNSGIPNNILSSKMACH